MLNKRTGKKVFLVAILITFAFLPIAYEQTFPAIAASAAFITPPANATVTLSKKLDVLLADPKLKGGITGVSIRNADTGKQIYSNMGDIRLRPASNMKLLTGASALDVLGTDYQFQTEVAATGKKRGSILQGDVYLVGKGDPTLLEKDLVNFANELKQQGIKTIQGDLFADDSWYDDDRYSQDLNWSDEFNYVGAQVSALTLSPNEDYDTGTIIVEVKPGTKSGDQPSISLTPETKTSVIVNEATTVGKEGKKTISIHREHGTNRIIVEGSIPVGASSSRSWTAVWQPSELVLDVFQSALKKEGIQVRGKNGLQRGVTPEGAEVLATKKSMPLNEIYVPFMKLSNNGHAEMLVKEMGRVVKGEGSWNAGLAVMSETLEGFGIQKNTVVLRDGSGMSHKNLVSSETLTSLLVQAQKESWYPAFRESLPLAGEAERMVGGTLRNRLTGDSTKGNVAAKTGSITGVSTLSGYVTTKKGTPLVFSIMINNYITGPVTPIEDALVTAIAEADL
ncbi:D-alanyl-D-alanine carboxypeptidase/D-alanyl-D-alanine endopeptidase [Sporosarcina aquimarina]|uniref:D-alanyl-D-alanine carboxypeptidase/D-alanyl-D-alanine-endopeptidase n=1 Tax=Sporosarcina aquimarina TaxID=114975 RepID=A0ABU4FYN5_9BACL|nr:D-alanyl-D-alanine carboxypeptidase/D-alanyl-D-alanine-endopeptidase [Sporosarcina aquimarina]MDW0109836.1 D-alanyl-D-alanine carboxypeptidase/D-alanyl-D-alanine-endopeptidase [Sporosarcina aquimarina]